MKKLIKLFFALTLFSNYLFSQNMPYTIEKSISFFPDWKQLEKENIDWYYLIVPENWEKPNGKMVKIAVAVLKSKFHNKSSNATLFIEGGPGGAATSGLWKWLEHPIRQNSDIVLADVRGTGLSYPKFCPDLGKKFLEILAKNQNEEQDEQQKAIAAMACKQDLISRNIDLDCYNSKSIAKDFNALKTILKYKNWNVYGVSYGTYTAQVYANDFPLDIRSLILDSSISDISQYYNFNTKNYMSSLNKVFNACKNEPNCNSKYPNLREVYFETIEKLEKNPITVTVSHQIVPSREFTYNAEDFKVAIQQSLYNTQLIRVMPALIFEFNKRNNSTLSSLVGAFSGALGLDYGQYYCVSCKEALPVNSIEEFNKKAELYKELNGGLSFYKSDFAVCDKWNLSSYNNSKLNKPNDLSNLSKLDVPVLVFSGGFDPITPESNGKMIVEKFKNAFLVNSPISGHAISSSSFGTKLIYEFLKNPGQKPKSEEIVSRNKIDFVTNIKINKGVSGFANSINDFNLLFFAPFFIAIIILCFTMIGFSYTLMKRKKGERQNMFLKFLTIIASLLGVLIVIGLVLAMNETARENFYVLSFGLPSQFNYLFVAQWIFAILTVLLMVYFMVRIKHIPNLPLTIGILFSLILINIYFQYWGFLF